MLNQPEDFGAAFVAAWMARDAGALAALFAQDADFVNVVGLWWHNRSDIEKAHAYGLSTFFAHSTLRLGRTKCRLIGTEAAVTQSRLTLTGQTAPDGSTAGPRTTILTATLQRFETGWLAVAAQNTDVVAGAETHLAAPSGLLPQDYR